MNEAELHRRAGDLFERVVDLAEGEREALLSAAALREPEIAEQARRMVAMDPEYAASANSADKESDPAGLLGHALGPFEIIEWIGSGGMGAVYLARRNEPEESVAIKFLPSFGASAQLIERFQYETELLASFKHTGIVGYRGSGKSRGGDLYLVMEYIEGEPLSPDLPAVQASVAKAVDFVISTASAVQHMHGRAILHRDLKPGNILIHVDEDGRPRPILIDMGIARPLRTADEDWASQTLGPLGTPAYMSPEQMQASPDVDVRTDVYGLGAVLYELLTGAPARGLGKLREWDRSLIDRLQSQPARPPSEVIDSECFGRENSLKRARQVRGDLDSIVVKALEHNPADRYPSVEAFSADLYRWLDRRPVVARPINTWGRIWRLIRRNPGATLAGAAAVLVLVGTSLMTSISLMNEQRTQSALAEQLETTDRIRRFIVRDVFERATPELDGPEQPVIELVRGAARALGADLDDRPAVALGMRSVLLAVLTSMGDLSAAQEQSDAGWPLAKALPAVHPQRLEFELEAARLLVRRNRDSEAEQALLGLIPRLDRPDGHPGGQVAELRAQALAELGVALLGLNRLQEANLNLNAALELTPEDDPRHVMLLTDLALVDYELNGASGAVAPMQAALARVEERFGPHHVWVMEITVSLCSAYLDLGQPELALPYGRRSVAIADRIFEPDNEKRLTALNNLAACLSVNREFEEAILYRYEVLERRTALFGERNPAVARAAMNLASTLQRAGQSVEALEPAERAVEIALAISGPRHPDTARAYHALAVILDAIGAKNRCIEAFDNAIAIYEQAAGHHTEDIARAREQRATALFR